MFGFRDKQTPETARLLFVQAQEAARRYLRLSQSEVAEIVTRDFPDEHRYVAYNEIGFGFPHLPDFNFGIMWSLDEPTLTIFGGGAYDGFMLQRPTYDAWHVDVAKPFSRPLGPKAKSLADILMHQYGATNPRASVERLMNRRF